MRNFLLKNLKLLRRKVSAFSLIFFLLIPLGGFSQTADFSIALSSQCGNGTATFTDTSGPEPVTQWSWDFGNSNSLVTTDPALGQNPSAIFPTPGAYTVSLSVNGGLAVSKEIIIHPNPEPDFSPSTTAGCEPLDIVLSATASNVDVESFTIDGKSVGGVNGGNIVDYQWDFQGKLPGVDDTEPVLSLSGIGANDYGALLIVTDEFGCKGTKFQPSVFQVHPTPTADFNLTKDNSCGLGDVTFDGLATIASGQVSEYQWDVDNDGSIEAISESYTHSFATAGIFDVALSLKSDQGCLSNKVIKQVQFNDGNTTDFSFSGNCAGQMVTFTDESSATAIAWSWDFNGDNIEDSNAQNPTTTFSSAGNKTVTLTATHSDACVMVISKIVAISSASAAFTYDLSAACAPSYKVLFTNTSSASTGTITSYSWDFDGDNVEDSNLANPNFEFNASGTHPVKLTVVSSEACESTFTKEVIINEKSVDFSIISPAMGCEGLSVDFEGVYSDVENDAVLSWNWTFEGLEESSISNPSHTFASRGEYDVKLRIETSNGCILTESKPDAVQVGKKPIITNVTDPPSDCANDAVSFTATFTGLADSLFWDFSNGGNKTSAFTDGNSPQTISHTFTEDSDSHSLIVTAFDNGCASDAITVSNIEIKQPVARFTASKTVVCAVPETVTFTNLSSSDAVGTSYEWDFNGDNIVDSSDENPSFVYTVAGDYTVTLTVYNPDTGCTDERSQKIFVTTSSPNFVTDKTLACHPANISFTNQIIANSSANFSIDKVEWDFDNNGSIDSDEENPNYTYASPNSYGIRMTVTEENGCVYPVLKDGLVSINGPVASFTKLPLEACLNDEIAFTNTTTKFSADPANPDNYSYSWNFGDGASSNLKNPTHTYVSKDVFEVSLLVSDALGCSNTFTESNSVIVPNLVAGFTTSKEIYCLGETVEFTNTANTTNGTASITNYEWDLDGNGSYEISTASDANQSLLFSVAGTFTVKQKITSSLGCTDEFSKEITIVDGDGSFTPDAINLGCAPASTTFRANDGVDVVESYAWDFGDGGISEKRDPMHFYVNPGSYNVTLTVVLTGGCTKTSTQTVFVAGPVGDFSYNNITGCANPNHEVSFTASNMQDVTSLVWDFGNGITSSEVISLTTSSKSTIYNYKAKGTKLPILILTDDGTCGAYSYIREDLGRINTSTPPTVDFSKSSGDNICENVEFQFSDLSVLTDDRYQIVSWSWDFDEDGVEDSNAKNPSFTYTAAGTYDVSLTVTTNFGCTASLTKPAFITVVSPDNLTDLAITITEPGTVNSKFCSSDNVTFNGSATTSNGDNSISGWVWDFGDGNDASAQNAPHSYSAVDEGLTRTVTLTVTDNSQCVQSITKEVSIYKVDADFSITSSPVLRGNNIAFADLSTSKINVASDGIIDDWAWTFEEGTPTSSAAQNPSIIYNTIGSNYNVGLTVTNNEGCTDNASKTVSVLNNPPVVSDFGVSGNEDTDIAITQIDFDSNFDTSLDPSQTIVKVKIISLPANGDLYIGTTKISTIGTELTYVQLENLKFVPDENWNGSADFTYNASDGIDYAAADATITITVNQVQDVPVVANISLENNKDVNTTFDIATFEDKFSDVDLVENTNPDFQNIKITSLPISTDGILTLNSIPVIASQEIAKADLVNLVFEPLLGFVGTASFEWNGSDGADYAATVAQVSINYTNAKAKLTDENISNSIKEDFSVRLSQLDFADNHSDTDVNDDPFDYIKIISLPSSGGVFSLGGFSLSEGQEITYAQLASDIIFVPANGYNGTITLEWDAHDGTELSEGPAKFTFTYVNTPPTVSNITMNAVNEDTQVNFITTDFSTAFIEEDNYDDLEKIRIKSLPSNGKLRLNGVVVSNEQSINFTDLDDLKYYPDEHFNGTDSFTWEGNDGTDYSYNKSIVNITVDPVQDLPTLGNISKLASEDDPVDILAQDFIDEFSDVDALYGNPNSTLVEIIIKSLPANGTLELNGVAVAENDVILLADIDTGSGLVFVPNPGYEGDSSFDWNASDGLDYATTDATVTIKHTNTPPVVASHNFGTKLEDVVFTLTRNNFETYYSDADATDAQFKHVKIVSLPSSDLGVFTIDISGTDEVLTTGIYSYSNLLAGLKFTPKPGINGTVNLVWNAEDGTEYAASDATFSFTYVNSIPIVNSFAKPAVDEDNNVIFAQTDFDSNYSDVDVHDSMEKIQITDLPDNGTLKYGATTVSLGDEIAYADLANLIYQPDANWFGNDSFTWQGYDGTVYSTSTSTISLTVDSVNDIPVADDEFVTSLEDQTHNFTANEFSNSYSDNYFSENSAFAGIQIVGLETAGYLKLNGVNVVLGQELSVADLANLTFSTNLDENGVPYATFQFKVFDGEDYSTEIYTMTVNITPVNDEPSFSFKADADVEVDEDSGVHIENGQAISINKGATNESSQTLTFEVSNTNTSLFSVQPSIDANGDLTFTPANNASGTTTVTVLLKDDGGTADSGDDTSSSETFTITVNAVNDPPLADNESVTTLEDQIHTFTGAEFSDTYSDVEGSVFAGIRITELETIGNLKYDGAAVIINQVIALADISKLTFTPQANKNGTAYDSFKFEVFDGTAYSDLDYTMTIDVTPVNDEPSFTLKSPKDIEVDEDSGTKTVPAQVTTQSEGPENESWQNLTLHVSHTNSGLFSVDPAISAAGILTFTPTPNVFGTSTVTVYITDNGGLANGGDDRSDSQTFTITVNSINDIPIADDELVTGLEDVTYSFASTDFSNSYNDVETAFSGIEITGLESIGNLEYDGVPVTVGLQIATADISKLKFIPNANENGNNYDAFTFKVFDGEVYSVDSYEMTVNITPVNDEPSFAFKTPKDVIVTEDVGAVTVTGQMINISEGPVNESAQNISILISNDNNSLFSVQPSINASGYLSFTPAENVSGTTTVSVYITDNGGTLNNGDDRSITQTFTITVEAANDPPVAQDDSFTTDEDVLLSGDLKADNGNGLDTDVDSDPADFTYTVFNGGTAATNGTILLNVDGTFTYEPNPDFVGPVSFTYQVCDDASAPLVQECVTATVSITVNPIQDKPTLGDISKLATEDDPVVILAQDFIDEFSDVDALYGNPNGTLVEIKITSLPTNGTLELNGVAVILNQVILLADIDTGSGLVFVPNDGYEGDSSFDWNASDGLEYATTDATVTIKHTNTPPVVTSHDFGTKLEDVVFTLTRNNFETYYSDADATDSQFKHVKIVSLPSSDLGVFTIDISGTDEVLTPGIYSYSNLLAGLKFTPKSGANGTVNLVWNGEDGTEYGADDATFSFTYINSIPTVADFAKTAVDEDNNVIFATTDFSTEPTVFTDVDVHDDLDKIQIKSLPTNGSLELDGVAVTNDQIIDVADLGKLVYIPNPDFNGTDSFTWIGNDGTDYSTSIATVSLTVNAVNDPPAAQNDSFNTDEDVQLSGDLKADNGNGLDADIDSNPADFIYTVFNGGTAAANGTILLNADGTFTYDPNPDFVGTVSFTYQVCDDASAPLVQECVTATVSITVDPVQDKPTLGNISKYAPEDNPVTISAQDFKDQFSDVDALYGNANSTLVKIKITSLPDPIIGFLYLNGVPVTLNQEILVDDIDVGLGLVFIPNSGHEEEASFNWNASDGIDYALTDATVNIKHTNTPPVVVSHDFGTKLEDVVFTLTRNDFENYYSDADATDTQFKHVKIVSLPSSDLGIFTIDISGTDEVLTPGIYSYSNLLAGLKFTPKPGANGTVNLVWNGEDGTEYGADNATFSFTYINSIPTVADFSKPAVDEDSNVIFTATDFSTEPTVFSDVDIYDDLDEIQIKSLPFNGTLQLDGVAVTDEQIISVADLGKLVYIPNPNFDGSDSFTWKGNDGTDYSSSTSTVSLFVNAVNDPPVVQDDSFNTDEDVQLSGNLKANNGNGLDTDVDSDPDDFIYTIADGGTASTNGTILLNADGTFTYEPNPDFFGVVSFTYQVCDDASTPLVQECVTATVTITVDPINDTPVAVADSLWLKEDASISGNVFDNDEKLVDTPVVIVSNTDPANGTLVLNADGTFTYTPNSGYFGDDSFTYTLHDADGEESTATVSIVVDPLDYEPIANDDFDTINEDETSSGDLLSNDEDLINPPVVVISNTNPANGTVVVNADGTYIYTPDVDFNGIDTFTYTIEDADGDRDTATVSITVNPVNDTPIAVNDTNTVDEDTPVSANVLDNDTNLGDGPVTVVSNTDPANGTVVVNADGTYTYTPDEGFFGTDTFEYTLEDADGEQSTATITITVNSVNDVPLGVDDVNLTDENTVVTGNVLKNDSDVDGDLLTVVEINGETALVGTNIQLSGGGILRLNADGTYEFDPNGMYEYLNTDEEAYESFTYVLNDGTENGNEVSVVITIVGVNDAPIADDDQIDALDNEEIRIDVLDGDFDADGDDLIVSIVTDPIYGDVIVNEDGSISYIANLGAYCETDQITYQICDPEGLCDQATVTIEIGISDQDEDSIPDAIETLTTDTDSDSTLDYLDLDSDNDGISDEDEAQISDSCTNLPIDTDADGIPDYRDTDSDNDGFTDKEEGDDDCDNDGIADYIDAYDDCAEYVFIPEGFSPNGDGINDFFVIKGIKDFPNSVLMIFNRWGAKIYSTKGYQNNWDGRADNSLTVGSEIIPEGTYYYVIDLGDGSKALKGFIYINY